MGVEGSVAAVRRGIFLGRGEAKPCPYPRQLEADWILALLEGLYENNSAG